MNKIRKLLKTIFLGLAIGVSTLGLTSCSSTEKTATSYDFSVVSCIYNTEENKTEVVWVSNLVNNSIFDIKKESFKFDLYENDTFVRTTDYITWTISIKHGKSDLGRRNFTAAGKVTDIKINTWTAKFANLWETYTAWFIAVIIAAPLLAIIYIIIMIINDLDLDDLIEFLEDHLWFISMIALPFVPYLISSLVSGVWSWVPPLIITGGLVATVLVVLAAHLIKYLIDENMDMTGVGGKVKVKKHYDSKNAPFLEIEGEKKRYYINDLKDNRDTLMYFSKKDLRDYCVQHEWNEAADLHSKEKLVILLMDKSSEKDNDQDEAETATKKKPVKIKKYSKTKFEDIAGLEEAKKSFREKVIMPFLHPEIYEKFGKKAGGGILLYGLPGTGKTMFAEAAANEIDALFIPIKCSDVKSKWYGESEKKVKNIFAKAKKAEKAIIFFDEFEAIGAKRTDNSDNGNNDLVPQILTEMQGVGSSANKAVIIVIAATNKPWAIDSAFMRPGRFDEKIYIPLPDLEARKRLFELQLKKLPISSDLDFDYLAKITDGFNGADIKEVCEKLKMSAINDSLEKGEEQTIGMDDVHRVEGSIKSSVSLEDIERLQEFEEGIK